MDEKTDLTPAVTATLGKTPLAHLIVYMSDKKLEGSIVFQGEDNSESIVVFAGGAPAKARTSYQGTYLSKILLQLGFLDDIGFESSVALWSKSGGLYGEQAVNMGLIDRPKLLTALREQTRRRVLKLFEKLNDGAIFAFYKQVNLLTKWGGSDLTPVDPLSLLWDGIHVRPNDPHVDPTLNRLGSSLLRLSPSVNLHRLDLSPQHAALVEFMRARQVRLEDLLAARIMPVRQTKLALYYFLITRSLEIVAAAPVEPVRTEAPAQEPQKNSPIAEASQASSQGVASQRNPSVAGVSSQTPASQRNPSVAGVPPRSPSKTSSDPHIVVTPARLPTRPGFQSTPDPPESKPVPGSPAAIEAERQAIRARAAGLDKEDYFAVLAVPKDATADVMRSAYFALAKKWHPDRLPAGLTDVREEAARVFAKMSEAFQTLTDPARRQQYVEALKTAASGDDEAKVMRILGATREFQKAQVFLRKKDMEQASKFAKLAFEGDPEQSDHVALYAWTLVLEPENFRTKNFDEPLQLLNQAVAREPRCELALFYRASLQKLLGNNAAAIRDFRQVAEINPRNIDAAREVRLHEMRGTSKPDSHPEKTEPAPSTAQKGFLGKLFKR